MVRVITQETYDEVVRENMDEFEMSPEEAIKDAIAQFQAQGVDLSNIIKDLVINEDLVSSSIKKLTKLSENCTDDESILTNLEILSKECNKDLAHRLRASKEGAYDVLLDILEKKVALFLQNENGRDALLLVEVLNSLAVFMDTQPDLLDNRGLNMIFNILDNIENLDILTANVRWANVCCLRHEMNRQKMFAADIGTKINVLLQKQHWKLLSECLLLLRRMTLDDDVRVPFGKAHDHARGIAVIVMNTLTSLLKEHTKPPLVCELLVTLAALLVRHELCKMAADTGVDVLFTILADNFESPAVIMQAHRLITALAGHDDVKRTLVKSGIVPLMVTLLNKHMSNATTVGVILKSIGALTLREPDHSKIFLENGAAETIVACMKVHPADPNVQKMACIAIRNLVARCREFNCKFHELGVEPLLQEANKLFADSFGFEIKAALRDVGCDVELDEQWTGKGVSLDNE